MECPQTGRLIGVVGGMHNQGPHSRFCLLQPVACVAFSFAGLNAGSQSAARMAMQAMTTSRSIQVTPAPFRPIAMVSILSVIASYSVSEPPAGAIHKLRSARICDPTAALRDKILGFLISCENSAGICINYF
jgi:hypothetical protein